MTSIKHTIIICLILFMTSACSMIKPIPSDITIKLTTDTQLNPDRENRSSPVVLRIYQLSSDKIFKQSDFFQIYDNDKATLADAMIKKQELELNPNESRKIDITPDAKTKFIGLLAAFQNMDNAKWQQVIKIKSHPPTGIPVYDNTVFDISLNQNKINLLDN